jgi:uncharacterized protein YcbK (DUF882 family)
MGHDKREKLTDNFYLDEFACNDEQETPVPQEYMGNTLQLAENLQILRDHLDRPIVLTNGYRTPAHNEAVGGSKKSQHLEAKAADIVVSGMSPVRVKQEIERLIDEGKLWFGGVGLYNTFVHVDIRSWRARWNG